MEKITYDSFTVHRVVVETCESLEKYDVDLANKLRKAIMNYGAYGTWDSDYMIDVFMIAIKEFIDAARY